MRGTDSLRAQVCSSAIDDYFHREAIKKVEWVRAVSDGLTVDSSAEENYQLASVSGDGKAPATSASGSGRGERNRHCVGMQKLFQGLFGATSGVPGLSGC